MKYFIYKSLIIVFLVCSTGILQAQSDLQTFRANYERMQQIYSPDEPDAILMADSLARISEQPYKALYNYLVSTMLPKLRPFMGLKSDVHDIRDVMRWSQEEVYDNMFRYADTAFSQLFTYGLIPADGFEFMMRPGNISSLPGMTLMDVALLSLIDYHLYPCDKYIDSAVALHRERNDRELLIEYELYLLDLEYKDFPKERDPNHYGQALSALRQKYGQSAAIDYENAMFLYKLVEHYEHDERQNDTVPEELRKEYSLWSERFFRDVKNSAKDSFYRENATIMLEHITRPEVLPRTMSEYLMPAAKILLPIHYRNVDTLYVTAYRNVNEDGLFILSHSRFPNLQSPDYVGPVTQQRFVLPQAMPHRFRSTDLFLDSLPVGNWLLLYHKTPVCDSASTLMAQKLTVTNIKAEQVTMGKHATIIFTDARTGEPLKGLKVVKENMDNNFSRSHCRTDRLGRIRVLNYNDWEFLVHDGPNCVFSFFNDNWEYEGMDRKSRRQANARYYRRDNYTTADLSRTILDRSLYRPGQALFFNVYLINERKMRSNTPITVVLKDFDNKEISRISLKTNEFGTASGSFVLPEGLTQGGIVAILDEKGNELEKQHFNVAAYKLPTFFVRLDELKGSVSANDTLHFTGRAVTFTGEPIPNAQVSVWLKGDRDPNLHYYLQTDPDGRFSFTYKAQDTNIYRLSRHVYVSVTDINGETQQVDKEFTLYQKPFDVYIFAEDVDLSQSDTFRSKISVQKEGSRKINLPTKVEIYRVQEPDSYKPLIYYGYFKPNCPMASDEEYQRYFPQYSFDKRDNEPRTWPSLERVYTQEGFMPNGDSLAIAVNHWGTGLYRIVVSAQDSLGRTDTAVRLFYIQNLASNIVATTQTVDCQILSIKEKTLDISLATRLNDATVFCEVFQNGRKRFSRLLHLSEERQRFPVKIRPGFSVISVLCHATKDNKNHSCADFRFIGEFEQQQATSGILELRLTRWNRKLQPGDSVRWEMEVVNATTGKHEPSELLVWMVDTALYTLPQAYPFSQWITTYGGVKRGRLPNVASMLVGHENLMREYSFTSSLDYYYPKKNSRQQLYKQYDIFALDQFPSDYRYSPTNFSWDFFQMDHTSSSSIGRLSGENIRTTPGRSVTTEYKDPFADVVTELESEKFGGKQGDAEPQNRFRIRRDFRETAFFLPQLQTNDSGRAVFTFTVPDQLTTWRFYAQAHTKNLHTGHLSGSIVAKLPMMLQSNAPRFLREGDTMDLHAKITNVSEERLSGTVTLEIIDTVGDQPVGMILGGGDGARGGRDGARPVSTDEPFDIAPGTAEEVHFRIVVPDGISSVTYRLVAKAGHYGDGEERTLPVLPKRMLVTEAYPFFVPANTDTTLVYNRFRTHSTPTLAHEQFAVEATTNPAWLAIQTLPALLQPTYESNDRTFATLFAAAMLQKVQKGAAQRITDENLERLLNKSLNNLKSNQLDDGGWSWTGKNIYSRFITCEVVSGFCKLHRMGVVLPAAQKMLSKAVTHADSVQVESYREYLRYLKSNPNESYPLDYHDVLYLYMRSSLPVDSTWLSQPYVQCMLTTATQNIPKSSYTRQAKVALILHRIGRTEEAKKIVENLRKQAVTSRDQGMYWRRKRIETYYPWYDAPIEEQALLIEAFSEISPREEELKAMKQWLLLQKKGNEWQSTRATLAAVYVLLLNFTADELETSATTITVGGEKFSTAGTADKKGTGYLQHTWNQEEVTPSLGEVVVRTDAAHPVIGACHWQYWEDMEKVESEGSGLSISRTYFHQPNTVGGYAAPVTADNPAHLGERITVRVTVTSDRDLDFVHVTDPRPAAFEPVNENKRYFSMRGLYWVEHPRYVRWSQDIRDTSTEFFFRHFPKGTFAVEYDVFATQTGEFTTGISEVECLYAPEWRGHYDNAKVKVR